MASPLQFQNIVKWLRLFTYLSATVLLITNNSFRQSTYLIPLALLLSLVDYSRDYVAAALKNSNRYVFISIAVEMLLILCVEFLDRNDVCILFFFVLISSVGITYPFHYSIPLAVIFIGSGFFVYAERNGLAGLSSSFLPLGFSYGVSTAFVMGMSYLVKQQRRERENLSRINGELERAYKKLIETSAAAHQLTVEEERTRMAREIHDTLAHTLTTLIVQLEVCKKLASLDPSRLPQELEKAQELSRSGFTDIKRSIKALRPQAMESKSFSASILSLIHEVAERTKVQIAYHNDLPETLALSSQAEIALFRAIQESITNSIRHGEATEIQIDIRLAENELHLSISDNGKGCSHIKKGYGTRGIQERIESLKGKAVFSSMDKNGFQTKILLPTGGYK